MSSTPRPPEPARAPKPATRSLFFEIAAAVILSGLITFALFYVGATIAMRVDGEPDEGPGGHGGGRRDPLAALEELTGRAGWHDPANLAAWAAERPWLRLAASRGGEVLFDNRPSGKPGGMSPWHERSFFYRDGVRIEVCPGEPRSRFFSFRHVFPFVTILVTTFVSLFLYMRRVLRPLGELVRATRAMSKGDFAPRLGRASTREFDLLYRSFEEMAGKLGAAFTNHRVMLGSISHDLRHFLNRMRLTAEVDVPDAAVRASLVEDIDAMLGYVDRAAEALRATHGEEVYHFEPTDLSAMVDGLARAHAVPAAVAPGLVARADASWLALLVRNLLHNAAQHGADPRARLAREGEGFMLEVDDLPRAPVDPATLPLLFQPFYRGDAARTSVRGSGLGLFIVRAVAEAHGFSATLEVTPEGRFLARVAGPLAPPAA